MFAQLWQLVRSWLVGGLNDMRVTQSVLEAELLQCGFKKIEIITWIFLHFFRLLSCKICEYVAVILAHSQNDAIEWVGLAVRMNGSV